MGSSRCSALTRGDRLPGRYQLVDGLPHFLSTHAGDLIAELATSFELVWCSGWEEQADVDPPGGPRACRRGLPHLSFPAARRHPARHWKLASIEAFAGRRRPLAWVDDAFDDSCHAWAAERPGPTLLVRTDPAVGLTAEHIADLLGWAQKLPGLIEGAVTGCGSGAVGGVPPSVNDG